MEDAEHYFLRCMEFTDQINILFHSTRIFHPFNIDALLFGKVNLDDKENAIVQCLGLVTKS